MPERVSGPYRGYYISASARLTQTREPGAGERNAAVYVGSVNVAQGSPDNVQHFEALVDLGGEQRFANEDDALEHVEKSAREYIDRRLQKL
jgi:hypothetical protein